MEKVRSYFKKGVLILSLYLICQLFIIGLFEVVGDEGSFLYAIPATILIIYLYGSRRKE